MGAHSKGREVFNKADFLERVEGDMELARQLVSLFFEDAAENMSLIRRGLDENDAGKIAGAAHSLKGASGNLSAVRVSMTAAELERAAKENRIGLAGKIFDRLEHEMADFESALGHQILSADP